DDLVTFVKKRLGLDELITFVKKRLGLSVTHLTASEAHKAHSLLAASNAIALALLHSLKGPEAEAFAEASRDIDDIEFIATTDANIAAEFRIVSKERPAVAVIKKEDEKFVAHDGPFTSSAIAAFVTANKLPLVTTYDEESQYTIFNSDIKKQVLLLATNETYAQHLPVVKEAARRVKGLALFVYINSDLPDSEHALEYFGFRHGDTAIMGMVSNETNEVKFKFNGQLTTEDIEAFARELAADRLEPYYLSDPIPEKNDGPVLTVVGKNFKHIVMDRTKDVLLKIDVDHCDDCIDLHPTFKKLALKFSDAPSLAFPRMNAHAVFFPSSLAFPLLPSNPSLPQIDVDHCDDCTDLDPTFKKLALKFSGVPSLAFARMNARNNEYPGLEVSDRTKVGQLCSSVQRCSARKVTTCVPSLVFERMNARNNEYPGLDVSGRSPQN
ncbi:unnamed protein product, partial [Closterium sp. Naga37s-1]